MSTTLLTSEDLLLAFFSDLYSWSALSSHGLTEDILHIRRVPNSRLISTCYGCFRWSFSLLGKHLTLLWFYLLRSFDLSVYAYVALILNTQSHALSIRLTVGLVLLLRGVDLNDHCSWCHYLSCVPTSKWSCNTGPVSCQVNKLPIFPFLRPFWDIASLNFDQIAGWINRKSVYLDMLQQRQKQHVYAVQSFVDSDSRTVRAAMSMIVRRHVRCFVQVDRTRATVEFSVN